MTPRDFFAELRRDVCKVAVAYVGCSRNPGREEVRPPDGRAGGESSLTENQLSGNLAS